MDLKRRDFFKLAAAGTTASALACKQKAPVNLEIPPSAQLKLSCQENVAPGESLNEKLDFLEEHGIVGLEPSGRNLPERVQELEQAIRHRKIKISAICAGFKGWLIAEDPAIRDQAMTSIKEILISSGELQSTGMIVVPAFNKQASLPHKESRMLLIEQLQELGAFALQHNTRILLEPLNRREAHFLRQVADAAAICRDADSAGVAVMGDFWHMTWEETSDMGAFISAGPYLHHVHIASRERRKMPGEDSNDLYIDGFRGLKMIGYQDYVSLECGSVGDKHDTIPAAAALIKDQWERA